VAAPKYLKNNAGVLTEVAASETSGTEVIVATNSSGQIDLSFMPTGIGPDTVSVVASEALAAGDFVNIYNNTGTANCRKADASTTGKQAHGFVLSSVSMSGTALVYLSGINTQVTGATPGDVFLSDSTPGGFTSTAPTSSGHIVQNIGNAVGATKIQFDPDPVIVLA
jgi:hypothetical protein